MNYREAKAVKEVANSAHEVSRKLLQMKDSGSKAVAARASSFGQIKYVSDQLAVGPVISPMSSASNGHR